MHVVHEPPTNPKCEGQALLLCLTSLSIRKGKAELNMQGEHVSQADPCSVIAG